MADSVFLGSVYATAELRTDQFKQGASEIRNELNNLDGEAQSRVASLGGAFNNFGSALSDFASKAAIPAAAIGLIGKQAIEMGSTFEDSMAKVAAVSGITVSSTDKAFQQLRKTAIQLGIDTRFSSDQAAQGLYELASAGLSVEDQMKVIPSVLNLATVASIDVGDAANRVVSSLKMFQSTGLTAAQAVDIMSQTVNSSLLHFDDLSDGLRMTGASFGVMKQPLYEAATALAVLSDNGLKGAQAGEYLRQTMQYMAAPLPKAIDMMKQLGIITADGANQFFDASGKMKPFSENVELLRQKMKGLTDEDKAFALQQMFALQGSQAMNILMGTSKEKYDQLEGSIKNSTGASQKAADVMNSTLKFQIDQLKSSVETAAISFNTAFTPTLKNVIQVMIDAVNAFTKWSEANPQAAANLGKLLGGFVALVTALNAGKIVFGLVGSSLKVLWTFGGLLASVFTNVLVPAANLLWGALVALAGVLGISIGWLLLIIAVIAAVAIGIYLLITHWTEVSAFLMNIWNQVVAFGMSLWQGFTTWLGGLWTQIQALWATAWAGIVAFFTVSVPAFIQSVVQFFMALPQMILDFVWNVIILGFVQFLGFMLGLVIYGIPALVEAVVNFLSTLPARVGAILTQVQTWWTTTWTAIWAWVTAKAVQIVNDVTNFFNTLPGKLLAILTTIANWFTQKWNEIWAFLTDTVPKIIADVVKWISELPPKVVEWMNNTKNRFVEGFQATWNAIIGEISTWPGRLYNWGVNLMNSLADGIKSAIGKIADAFKAGMDNARRMIEGHSPPVAGPFMHIDKWGFNIGQAWVQGMTNAISGFQMPDMGIGNMSMTQVAPAPVTNNITNSPQMSVNIGMYAGTPMEKREIARQLDESLTEYKRSIGEI